MIRFSTGPYLRSTQDLEVPRIFWSHHFPDGSLVSAAKSLWGLVYDLLKGLFCGLLARDSASLAAVSDRSVRQS